MFPVMLRGDADAVQPCFRRGWGDACRVRRERRDLLAVQRPENDLHLCIRRNILKIADFCIHMQGHAGRGKVEIIRMHIGAVGLQIGVERQRQVHIRLEIHPHRLADATQHRVGARS